VGWEKRRGRRYYYRKRREGGRVVSEYLGRGEWVATAIYLDGQSRKERARKRAREQREHEAVLKVDRQLAEVGAVIAALTRAALLESGYHLHKGQWRRRRGGETSRCG